MHNYDKNNNDHIKYDIAKDNKEAIILIGSPGSGKSIFCENNLTPKGYIHINQGTLKTREKVIKYLEKNLKEGKKVIIDIKNPEKNEDRTILKFAKNMGIILEHLFF